MPPTGAAAILLTPDVPRSVAFYVEAFGFERQRYFDGNEDYAVIERAGAQVHLFTAAAALPHHTRGAHVADVFVWVDDLDAVVARAVAAGLTAERGPEHYDSSPVGTTEVVFADLDGNWVCFGQAD